MQQQLTLGCKLATPLIISAHVLKFEAYHPARLRDIHNVIDASE